MTWCGSKNRTIYIFHRCCDHTVSHHCSLVVYVSVDDSFFKYFSSHCTKLLRKAAVSTDDISVVCCFLLVRHAKLASPYLVHSFIMSLMTSFMDWLLLFPPDGEAVEDTLLVSPAAGGLECIKRDPPVPELSVPVNTTPSSPEEESESPVALSMELFPPPPPL